VFEWEIIILNQYNEIFIFTKYNYAYKYLL
jgi:hypothetical protein